MKLTKGHEVRDFEAPEGIVCHPGREQPYTVWRRKRVVKFCTTREEAEKVRR